MSDNVLGLMAPDKIIENIYSEAKIDAMKFIANSAWRDPMQEDQEDIFIESVARLYDLIANETDFDYIRAKKMLYGIIKKKIILYGRKAILETPMSRIKGKPGELNYHIESDISDVAIPNRLELYDRERDKLPERVEYRRRATLRYYYTKRYTDWDKYKHEQNTNRHQMRLEKKYGVYTDKRMLANKPIEPLRKTLYDNSMETVAERIQNSKPKYDGLFGVCRKVGYCVDECGLCAFIKPFQTPSYKSANQALRYKNKKIAGSLFTPDTEGIIIDYKEPLTPVEEGFGYVGAITVSPDKTCVQCHICGFYFKLLGMHVKEHDINEREYKKKFGLLLSRPLLTRSSKRDWEKKRPKNYTAEHLKQANEARAIALESVRTSDKIGKQTLALEHYNKFGICPAQMVEKFFSLQKKLGHTPSYREMASEYNSGHPRLLMKIFGTWEDVKYELGSST